MGGVLFHAFIYLLAGVVAVPVAKRLGLGSVLGYLLAGCIIGPVIGLVGAETQRLQEFAEFGVVMMLFLVGLELEPKQLWEMRQRLIGLGGLQVVGTAVLLCAVAVLLGGRASVALAVGLMATGSSTAIVLQTLTEKGLLKSDGGRASFAVLLFQDISVIPMLALLPLLARPEFRGAASQASSERGEHLLQGLPGWEMAVITILAVAAIVVAGHYLTRPLFRFVASAQLREISTATALMLVVGIALLMTWVGLSPALGTFLAGVVLANSEYRHELESDIEPFKGLLLGLFFITVGAGIDFSLLANHAAKVLALTLTLIGLKALALWIVGRAFKLRGADCWLFALGLAQVGEFAFVLLSFCVQNAIIPADLEKLLLLVVASSMLLTPVLFIVFERIVMPKFAQVEGTREADQIDTKGTAIIAGIGRFGQVVNRILRSNGYETVVLDLSVETLDTLSRFGVKAFFGDASRPDLLEVAGLKEARLLVVAIDDRERALSIVKYAKRVRPELHVVARAYDRLNVYDLFRAGCDDIVRETFDSATAAGRLGLEALGVHPYEADRLIRAFTKGDEASLRRLSEVYDPEVPPTESPEFMAALKQAREEEEAMLSLSRNRHKDAALRGWSPPSLSDAGEVPANP